MKRRAILGLLAMLFCHSSGGVWAADPAPAELGAIVGKTLPAGLVVRVGGDDLAIATELARTGRFLVLQYVPAPRVDALQRAATDAGVHGLVTIRPLPSDGKVDLPDCFADAVIVESDTLGAGEISRFLGVGGYTIRRESGQWIITKRPPEEGLDGWTHKWYGPSGNCVSQDRQVGPPQTIQWQGGRDSTSGSYPAIAEGVFASIDSARGDVEVRSAGNGLLRFSLPVRMGVNSDIVIDAGEILTRPNDQTVPGKGVSEYGALVGYRVADGQKVRTYDQVPTLPKPKGKGGPGIPCTLATPERIIACAGDELAMVDRKQGRRLWTARLEGGATWFSPRLLDGVVVAIECAVDSPAGRGRIDNTANAQAITAFAADTGQPLWRAANVFTPDRPALVQYTLKMNSLTLAAGKVFLYASSYQAANPNGFLAALDLKTGKQIWRFGMPEGNVKPRWAATDSASYIFYRDDHLYYVGGHGAGGIATFDPETGKLLGEFQRGPTRYFAYAGECSMSRATANYFIKASTTWFDKDLKPTIRPAARSQCGVGTFPALGMSFVTPAGCDCTAYTRGYQGFSSEALPAPLDDAARLAKGPAVAPQDGGQAEWPMFLANPQRNPVLPGLLPDRLKLAPTISVAPAPVAGPLLKDRMSSDYYVGGVTAPTLRGATAFVGLPDAQAVAAVDLKAGKTLWSTPVGGAVDTPPTLHHGLAIVGAQDGRIYALRQDTGEVVWSFVAAPCQRTAMLNGRVGSAFPVPGSVLVVGDKLWAVAGLHSYLGGLYLWSLDPLTGKILGKSSFVGADTAESAPTVLNDVLCANAAGSRFWISKNLQLDDQGKSIAMGSKNVVLPATDRPVITFERRSTIMTFTTADGRGGATHGWPKPAEAGGARGYRLLVDGQTLYSLDDPAEGRFSTGGKVLVASKATAAGRPEEVWTLTRGQLTDCHALNAMIKVGPRLYVGGGARDGSAGQLAVVDAADGKVLQEFKLPARVSASGLAATDTALVVSLVNGQILMFRGE